MGKLPYISRKTYSLYHGEDTSILGTVEMSGETRWHPLDPVISRGRNNSFISRDP